MQADIDTLNRKFALADALSFIAQPDGIIVAVVENAQASARICLQGAHLLYWHPRNLAEPVIWFSPDARLAPGKSPHSGAPVCWPWFGQHESDDAQPAHGFARNMPWEVVSTGKSVDGATQMTLRLSVEGERYAAFWPHQAVLELAITVGAVLEMALTTRNTGSEELAIGEALHTYFQVGDVEQVCLTGLDGLNYADKVQDFARFVQQGDVRFSGETDRVYLDTAGACMLEDPVLRRRIRIGKTGSRSTVVWTPWREKAQKMEDVGERGWRRMLCVESANALENRVVIAPGDVHTLAVTYRADPL